MEKAQLPVKECYCNISSISEIESIQIVPAKWYNGFFLVHDSQATECNQYLKCSLSAHEAHCFTCDRPSQMCTAITDLYFMDQGTIDSRFYSVELLMFKTLI